MVDQRWQKHGFYGAAILAALLLALALPARYSWHIKQSPSVSVVVAKEPDSAKPQVSSLPSSAPVPTTQPAASPAATSSLPATTPASIPQPSQSSASQSSSSAQNSAASSITALAPPQDTGAAYTGPIRRDGPPVTPAPRLPVEVSAVPPSSASAPNGSVSPAPVATTPDSPNMPGQPAIPGTPIGESATSTPASHSSAPESIGTTGMQAQHLAEAPQPDLVEKTIDGTMLPVIGKGNRQSWFIYSRPFTGDVHKPKIAIAFAGLGPEKLLSESAIVELAPDISLVFDPYSPDLGDWVARARSEGHEVFLSVPMEPVAYPRDDPGPYTLLTQLSGNENILRLNWVLSRASGYIGLTTLSGTQFVMNEGSFMPILQVLKRRGLAWLDSGIVAHNPGAAFAKKAGVPNSGIQVRLDAQLTPEAIEAAFRELVEDAKHSGSAVGMIWQPTPLLIQELQKLLPSLKAQGVEIVPVSTLLDVPMQAHK